MRSEPTDNRPRFGYVDHADNSRTPVRFVATSDPKVFLAVELDGRPLVIEIPADRVHIDVIGPGMSVQFTTRKTS
jgi:hypothetical protein